MIKYTQLDGYIHGHLDLIQLTLRKLDQNDLMLIIDKGLQMADFEKDLEWMYNINEVFSDLLH